MLLTRYLIFVISTVAYCFNNSTNNFERFFEIKSVVNPDLIQAIYNLINFALKVNYRSVYFIQCVDDEKDEYTQDLLTQLLIANNKKYAHRVDNLDLIEPPLRNVRQNSIFLLDHINNFYIIEKTIKQLRYRFSGNFLFVLVSGYFEEVEEIFFTLWQKNIYRSFVIYERDGEIILSTFSPFSNSTGCGNTKPMILAKYKNGKFDTRRLLSRRATNLNKCPVRIVTYIDVGYVNMRKFKNGSHELYGPGVNLMNTLSESLNYTNDLKIIEGAIPWGVIYENGTMTGMFEQLFRNNADIAISEYYMKTIRNRFFDAGLTQYTAQMVFIIPPGEPYKPLEKLLHPFDYSVWIVLLITICIALVVILIINLKVKRVKSFVYGRGVKSPIINILMVLLGLQQTKLPGRNFARFLLMMFLILCLVLRSIYQGSLFQFLQSDERHKEVQSIDEMIEKNFSFYLYESILDIVKNQTEIYKRVKLINSTKNIFLELNMTGHERMASLETLQSIQAEIANGSKIRYLKDAFMTFNIVMYFRKNFFLRDEIDNKIGRLLSGGIIDYWIGDSDKDRNHNSKENEPRNLNIDDMKGPFTLLFMGLSFSFLCFILEFLVHKCIMKKSNRSK